MKTAFILLLAGLLPAMQLRAQQAGAIRGGGGDGAGQSQVYMLILRGGTSTKPAR